jgi:hypothetical protein
MAGDCTITSVVEAQDRRPEDFFMQCNIDAKGKVARLCSGIIVLIVGVVLMAIWARPSGDVWKWVVSGLVLAGGCFQIFEAWAGWCVMRAMGFKMPM